jgi:hypothetical protein
MLPKRLKKIKKNKNFFETEIRLGIGLGMGQDWYRNVINSTLGAGKSRRHFELFHQISVKCLSRLGCEHD